MLIGDVGEGSREEIDVLPLDHLGLDFGWPCKEGDVDSAERHTPDRVPDGDADSTRSTSTRIRPRGAPSSGASSTAILRRQGLDGLYLWSDLCGGAGIRARRSRTGKRRSCRSASPRCSRAASARTPSAASISPPARAPLPPRRHPGRLDRPQLARPPGDRARRQGRVTRLRRAVHTVVRSCALQGDCAAQRPWPISWEG